VSLQFGKNAVRVYNAYETDGREEGLYITLFVKEYAQQQGYTVERSNTDLYGELRLHNLLYEANFKRSQTADADLEFSADRRWYVNLASRLIGGLGIV
jgi:hypothetical protein